MYMQKHIRSIVIGEKKASIETCRMVQASYRDPHAPARSKARQNDQKGAGTSPLFGTDGETNIERD